MSTASEHALDTEAAKRLWAEYQQTHDFSGQTGEIVGIDPVSGQIWFGEWLTDVVDQRDAASVDRPLFFERVGSPACFRKGTKKRVLRQFPESRVDFLRPEGASQVSPGHRPGKVGPSLGNEALKGRDTGLCRPFRAEAVQ